MALVKLVNERPSVQEQTHQVLIVVLTRGVDCGVQYHSMCWARGGRENVVCFIGFQVATTGLLDATLLLFLLLCIQRRYTHAVEPRRLSFVYIVRRKTVNKAGAYGDQDD